MRAMAGRGALQEGTRVVGDRVEIGVFTQDLAQDLPGHLSGLEFVLQVPTFVEIAHDECLYFTHSSPG